MLCHCQSGSKWTHEIYVYSFLLFVTFSPTLPYYKKNVRFQESMYLEKSWRDRIQIGHLSAIIHIHMAVIW